MKVNILKGEEAEQFFDKQVDLICQYKFKEFENNNEDVFGAYWKDENLGIWYCIDVQDRFNFEEFKEETDCLDFLKGKLVKNRWGEIYNHGINKYEVFSKNIGEFDV